ncbi:MAG: uroporphyrinogen decarboxylase family protein [Fimbriimonadales bacterium]
MLSGTGPDHLPLDVWLVEPSADMVELHTGTRDEAEALGLAVERVGPRYSANPGVWREAYRELGFDVRPDALIGTTGTVDNLPPAESLGAAYHLLEKRYPLGVVTRVDQLESLPWPDVDSSEPYRHIPEKIAAFHQRGRAAIGQMDCTAFEMTWYTRGMDNVYLDLVDGTGISDWLLDWYTHRAEVAVRHYAQAGADIIWLGDDVGTQRGMMMAVPFWQEHLKPRLKRVIDAARKAQTAPFWVAYHSDGDVRPIIPDLIEIGVQVLNPVQPECMPIVPTITEYRDRLAFWGMIGTQTTMPFGTPEDVRNAVSELRDLAEAGARIIVGPTHSIEPDVPWENLEMLVQEARKPLRCKVSQ